MEAAMTATTQPTPRTAASIARWIAEESMLFNNEDSPFRAAVAKGDTRLVVVTGENAGGKSLYVRVAASMLRVQREGHTISVSIRERVGGGTSEMAASRRSSCSARRA